jgi:hypothetical protein
MALINFARSRTFVFLVGRPYKTTNIGKVGNSRPIWQSSAGYTRYNGLSYLQDYKIISFSLDDKDDKDLIRYKIII